MLEDEADAPPSQIDVGDIGIVEQHRSRALVGLLNAGDHAQQRGLARARRAEQGDQFAGIDLEINVAENFRDSP